MNIAIIIIITNYYHYHYCCYYYIIIIIIIISIIIIIIIINIISYITIIIIIIIIIIITIITIITIIIIIIIIIKGQPAPGVAAAHAIRTASMAATARRTIAIAGGAIAEGPRWPWELPSRQGEGGGVGRQGTCQLILPNLSQTAGRRHPAGPNCVALSSDHRRGALQSLHLSLPLSLSLYTYIYIYIYIYI